MMKAWLASLILALFCLVGPSLGLSNAKAGQVDPSQAPGVLSPQMVMRIEHLIETYAEHGWFSGHVLIAHKGEPVFEQSVGWADHAARIPNQADTRFHLGSLMKNLTAVLVFQQVQAGRLALDDRLASFDLEFPSAVANQVSVWHLLSHQSGFPSAFPTDYRADPLAFKSMEEKLSLHRETGLAFVPGTEVRYSNYGFIVLGAIVEKVTGEPFDKLLKTHIFEPLGLTNTVYPFLPDGLNQSLKYTYRYDQTQRPVGQVEHHSPDGGLESTARDVLSFYRALFYSDALLSFDEDRIAPHFQPTDGRWVSYGGGLGSSAAVELDLDNDIQIIVLANTDQWVAEHVSTRLHSLLRTGRHESVRQPPMVFAWQAYQDLKDIPNWAEVFSNRYQEAGYSLFIGRVLNELGMALSRDGRFEDAVHVMNALIVLFPSAPQPYDGLAFVFFEAGDLAKAQATFACALDHAAGFSSDYSTDNYGYDGAEPGCDAP